MIDYEHFLVPRVLAVAAIDACLYYLLSYELNTQQVNGSAPITSIIYIDPCHALDAVQKSNCYEFRHLVLLFFFEKPAGALPNQLRRGSKVKTVH